MKDAGGLALLEQTCNLWLGASGMGEVLCSQLYPPGGYHAITLRWGWEPKERASVALTAVAEV